MKIDKTGLSMLALSIMVGTLLFAGFMLAQSQAAGLQNEGGETAKLDPETEEKVRRAEERAGRLAKEIEERFQSAEWKERIREIEEQARDIEQRFSSHEFQEKIREIEEAGQRMEERFQGEEWRQFEAQMETLGRQLSEQFQNDEWNEVMAQIQKSTQLLSEELGTKFFDSSEWKVQQKEIEEMTRTIQETLGEEWQQQMKEFQHELQEALKDLPK